MAKGKSEGFAGGASTCGVNGCTGWVYTNGYCMECGVFRPGGKRRLPGRSGERTLAVDEFMVRMYSHRLRIGFGKRED
jgi:hypothetical protein